MPSCLLTNQICSTPHRSYLIATFCPIPSVQRSHTTFLSTTSKYCSLSNSNYAQAKAISEREQKEVKTHTSSGGPSSILLVDTPLTCDRPQPQQMSTLKVGFPDKQKQTIAHPPNSRCRVR